MYAIHEIPDGQPKIIAVVKQFLSVVFFFAVVPNSVDHSLVIKFEKKEEAKTVFAHHKQISLILVLAFGMFLSVARHVT